MALERDTTPEAIEIWNMVDRVADTNYVLDDELDSKQVESLKDLLRRIRRSCETRESCGDLPWDEIEEALRD